MLHSKFVFSDTLLNSSRLIADPLADSTVSAIFETENPRGLLNSIASITFNNQILPNNWPVFLKNFFEQSAILPPWLKQPKLVLASQVYQKHQSSIQLCLFALSLPYCYAAAIDAEVLVLSQRLQSDAKKRLIETGQFLQDVMEPSAFETSGKAIRSIQKVRLMHAVVRHQLLKHQKWETANGLPINQESMAGTNLAFSLMVLRGLRKLYARVDDYEQDAYLHAWKIVGYLLGIDATLLTDNFSAASQLEKAIRLRHFKASEGGKQLAASLVTVAIDFFGEKQTKKMVLPIMKNLLGNEVFTLLGLTSENEGNILNLLKLKSVMDEYAPAFAQFINPMAIAKREETEVTTFNATSAIN